MMAFVGSAVTPKLNRRGHSFVWGLSQSPEHYNVWLRLPCLPSIAHTHPATPPKKSLKLPPHLAGIRRNWPTSPPLSTPSLNTPFWRADFYLYLAGDWQLTFCTGGNFWEWGQYVCNSESDPHSGRLSIHLCIYSVSIYPYIYIYTSIHLSIYISIWQGNDPVPHATSLLFQSPLLWLSFNFLSFPATANWKTPLEHAIIAKRPPSLFLLLSLCPPFKARRQSGPIWCIDLRLL